MKLSASQTKLVGLTMELDLKAKEYKILCEKLAKLKENNIDEKNVIFIQLKEEFWQNYEEIVNINKQIKELEKSKSS